ncbi:Oidioi.mRNA.OKI2018_I69.XSR.g15162.t1.cds [Oikopleura dioica]|uniref:Oidioi.mRNA.OKI2018_I69.XSR.g15162.t1.cds n=1 Tax=Oikopleura dioica TaxID=34765 RepID=A0ABN7SBZ3_OIKDI|nr:Oidioi.mRNA.OKI2018_I69.XSR.g15162.t1.cds [Oikopleura dioica]
MQNHKCQTKHTRVSVLNEENREWRYSKLPKRKFTSSCLTPAQRRAVINLRMSQGLLGKKRILTALNYSENKNPECTTSVSVIPHQQQHPLIQQQGPRETHFLITQQQNAINKMTEKESKDEEDGLLELNTDSEEAARLENCIIYAIFVIFLS